MHTTHLNCASTNELVQMIRKKLFYNQEEGIFYWTKDAHKHLVGKMAGTLSKKGRIQIVLNRKSYLAHRLAWLYVNGEEPNGQIDHINGNPLDNSFSNLRLVDSRTNSENRRKANRNNISGFLGVRKNGKNWSAKICVNGQEICLGTFVSPELAHQKYIETKRTLHKGCTI
jgi:hypothetical protein